LRISCRQAQIRDGGGMRAESPPTD